MLIYVVFKPKLFFFLSSFPVIVPPTFVIKTRQRTSISVQRTENVPYCVHNYLKHLVNFVKGRTLSGDTSIVEQVCQNIFKEEELTLRFIGPYCVTQPNSCLGRLGKVLVVCKRQGIR